ncbi:hypothetical protein [Microbulbifer sp.]|uniref:hypothetical protein n=1 Tax=Microbulbifer sp. TaxID=1908541 RepID=UPI003F2A259F
MNYKVLVAAALAASFVQANTLEERLPEPWFKNGIPPALEACRAGVDNELSSLGELNMALKCETEEEGFVSLMQQFDADAYRGTRLRYSAWVKADKVDHWGGLWMRVDEPNKPAVAFDNMQNRAIKGTQGWTRHEIVLDISPQANIISMGLLMNGRGQLWIKDIQIETVGTDAPTTRMPFRELPKAPQNLELVR